MAEKRILDHLDQVHLNTHTKYVDATNGNDSDSGSYYFPYLTVDYALGNMQSGQHIKLKTGTYADSVGIANKDNVIIEGMGNVTITSLIAMTNCENMTFRNIEFVDFAPGAVAMIRPKNIIFENCKFSSGDLIYDMSDLQGNVKFIDCDITGTLKVSGKGANSASSYMLVERNKGFNCSISGVDTDSIISVKDSIVKYIHNDSTTAEVLNVELDRLSSDMNMNDIPTQGSILLIDRTPERLKYLGHIGYTKDESFTINGRYMSQTIYLNAANGGFMVYLPYGGNVGAEINITDMNVPTWNTTNFPTVRVYTSETAYTEYQLNIPGGIISFYHDGNTWKAVV